MGLLCFCALNDVELNAFQGSRVSYGRCENALVRLLSWGKRPYLIKIQLHPETLLALPQLHEPRPPQKKGVLGPVRRLVFQAKPFLKSLHHRVHETAMQTLGDSDLLEVWPRGRRFNFVVIANELRLIEERRLMVEDLVSKHVVLSDFAQVRLAGGAWVDHEGSFHFTNEAGSYPLPESLLIKFGRALVDHERIRVLHLHPHGGDAFRLN